MGPSIFSSLIRLIVFAIALVSAAFLLIATKQLAQQQSNLISTEGQLKDADKQLSSYRQLQKQQLIHSSFAQEHKEFSNKVQEKGFEEKLWLERNLTVEGEIVLREEIQGYLMGVSKREGYIFVPSSFILKTELETDDLFKWNKGDGENLSLTLTGKYYIRKQ